MTPQNWIELLGAVFGLAGTFMLARKGPLAGWGFVAFLASNAAWIVFALAHRHWFLLAQYIGFTGVSLYGAWRWLVKPKT